MIKTVRYYFTASECNISQDVIRAAVNTDYGVTIQQTGLGGKMINRLLAKNYDDWIVFRDYNVVSSYDLPETPTPESGEVTDWLRRFGYIYAMTYQRYEKLLSIYSVQENNLLNKISTIGTAKFNDTPQNVGTATEDSYTTTITKTETSTDASTLMRRIDEIQNLYRDVEREWIEEFSGLFGERM